MRITRVVADADGTSRLEHAELAVSHPLNAALGITGSAAFASPAVRFATLPPGYRQDLHPAPHVLFMIILSGQVEIGTPAATTVLTAGDVLLADDAGALGHTTRVVAGPAHAVFVPAEHAAALLGVSDAAASAPGAAFRDAPGAALRGAPGARRPADATATSGGLASAPGRLAGKVAIVSGGGTSAPLAAGVGVGRAIALTFGRAGASVVIVDRDAGAAEVTLAAARTEGIDALVVEADVAAAEQCDRVVAVTAEAFGGVDVLVNNAAIVALGGAADADLAEWDRVLAVNLTGAMLLTRSSVRWMVDHGGGSIVNISSIAAARGHGLAAYAAAKGGLEALTVDTAFSYGARGVRANTVVVGSIDGPMSGRGGRNPRADRIRSAANPLGLAGTAWDVASAALFLASSEARWVTGTTLPVDGGMLTTLPTTMFGALQAAAAEPVEAPRP